MNENIVHKKIRKPVQCDAQPDPKQRIEILPHPEKQTRDSRQCKQQEKVIIVLKKKPFDSFL